MSTRDSTKRRLAGRLFFARRGVGPLLQRDYWGVVRACRWSPEEVVAFVARRFEQFAPPESARFSRPNARSEALEPGEVVDVRIVGAGDFQVRVLHADRLSFTLGTLTGHPEAGRITFGAYRNAYGDVLFHIRSRTRASSRKNYAGFLALGEVLQTNCWTEFVNAVACTAGEGVVGSIQATTTKLLGEESDDLARHAPTFVARG